MSLSIQEANESPLTFILRMMAYRDNIIETNQEEGGPIGETLIHKKFSHSVIVGLRSATLRLEIKPLMLNAMLTDDQLLREINKILSQHAESEKRLGRKVGVKAIEIEMSEEERRDNVIMGKLVEINALLTENQRQYQDLDRRFEEYRRRGDRGNDERGNERNSERNYNQDEERYEDRNQVRNQDRNNERNNNRGERNQYQNKKKSKFMFKCAQCERDNAYCTHCARCGSSEHKQKDCPKNQ